MSKFRTWLDCPVLPGEVNSGVDKVDRDGFIPLEKHLEMMKFAGRKLVEYRKGLARGNYQDFYDPIEAGEFDDDFDILLAGRNARFRLKNSSGNSKEAPQEPKGSPKEAPKEEVKSEKS